MTARFSVSVEVEDEPAQAMMRVLVKLLSFDQTDGGLKPPGIRVIGLQYAPDFSPSYPGLVGPGAIVSSNFGPSPLDEQNRLMAEFLEVAKKQLKQQKGDDEDWKGDDA